VRRTRAVMEKVWECGLMLLRDEESKEREIVGEAESEGARGGIL